MAVRRRHGSVKSTRRLSTWFIVAPVTTTNGAAAGTNLILSLNVAALAFRPFTLVRTYLEIALQSDQAAAIERQSIAVGMAVVSDQSVAIGITALPLPVTDADSNLFYLHQFVFGDESNLTDRTRPQTRLSVDSKAMRKVEIGQDIVLVAEGMGLDSGWSVSVAGRFLIKTN